MTACYLCMGESAGPGGLAAVPLCDTCVLFVAIDGAIHGGVHLAATEGVILRYTSTYVATPAATAATWIKSSRAGATTWSLA